MTKIIGSIMLLVAIVLMCLMIFNIFKANWEYQNTFSNQWDLAEKSSTIELKSEYIDNFVASLEKSGLQGKNSSLFWATNNTNFDQNMKTLKSLQSRLHEIKTMDINSFAYQTAIQQITAQEQGEAGDMLAVLESCWYRVHHPFLWNIYGIALFLGIILLGFVGFVIIII